MKLKKYAFVLAIAMMLPIVGAMTAHAQFDQNDPQESATTQEEDTTPAPKPIRSINKKLVGWHEAGFGTNGGRVGETLRANWIMLNESNGIDGQVVGISSPITVHLMRSGFVVGRSVTTADGSFSMASASPGPYTVIGYSPESIFAYSFNAVANDGEAINMPLSIQTLPITGIENNKLVSKLIQQYAPDVDFSTYGKYDIGEAKSDPAEYYGWNGLRNLTEDSIPSTSIRNHQVAIVNDGRMVGRLHQMHHRTGRPVEVDNTRILIIQNGTVIDETQADDLGVFQFEGLSAGSYGLVAIGHDGMLAVGLDLANGGPNVEGQLEETARINGRYDPLYRSISNRQEESVLSPPTSEPIVFDGCLCSPDSVGWMNNHVTEQNYVNALNEPLPEMNTMGEMPYNYFNGGMCGNMGGGDYFNGGGFGSGGGGGFGGGLGGAGNLLLPIGVGAIIADAVDDGNGNLRSPIILTSPF